MVAVTCNPLRVKQCETPIYFLGQTASDHLRSTSMDRAVAGWADCVVTLRCTQICRNRGGYFALLLGLSAASAVGHLSAAQVTHDICRGGGADFPPPQNWRPVNLKAIAPDDNNCILARGCAWGAAAQPQASTRRPAAARATARRAVADAS